MAQQFSRRISLTSDVTTAAFGFRPTYIRIDASTAGTAFFSFNIGTTLLATTNSSADSLSWQLTSGVNPMIFDVSGLTPRGLTSGFFAITATGSTTIINVLALRP